VLGKRRIEVNKVVKRRKRFRKMWSPGISQFGSLLAPYIELLVEGYEPLPLVVLGGLFGGFLSWRGCELAWIESLRIKRQETL